MRFSRQFRYVDEEALPLLRGVGRGQGGADYDWQGMERKEHMIILQVTLKGAGFLEKDGKRHRIEKNQGFLAEIPGDFRYFGEDWEFIYLEFSPVVKQWLSQTFYLLDFTEEQMAFLVFQTDRLRKRELAIAENATICFQQVLLLKEVIKTRQLDHYPKVQQIRLFLEEAYQEDLSLDQLAQQFQVSKYRLIREFKEIFQVTPMNYLQKVRINRSLALLWEGVTVREVAVAVGFKDSNYFAKVFRKALGMSPSDYREGRRMYE